MLAYRESMQPDHFIMIKLPVMIMLNKIDIVTSLYLKNDVEEKLLLEHSHWLIFFPKHQLVKYFKNGNFGFYKHFLLIFSINMPLS